MNQNICYSEIIAMILLKILKELHVRKELSDIVRHIDNPHYIFKLNFCHI